MSCDVFRLGALCLDGKIQPVPERPTKYGDIPQYDGKATISFGTLVSKDSITWIKPNNSNLLVADRVLLVNVSWEDLDKNGFVAGKTVLLNGQYFRCRLLQVGEKESVPNEWDKTLGATNEDNILWHWKNVYFWGTNISIYNASGRTVRGYYSARSGTYYSAMRRGTNIGFRPALEPLPSDTLTPNINLDGVGFYLGSLPGSDTFCPILQPTQENVFNDIPVGGKVKMYTFLKDGSPIHFGATIKDASKLTLTDRYYGDEYLVSWTISNGIAVANRPIKQ